MPHGTVHSLAPGLRPSFHAIVRRSLGWLSALSVCFMLLCSCAREHPGRPVSVPKAEVSPLPAARDSYDSEPRAGGVVGGPIADELAETLQTTLSERGAKPVPDGALAELAAWTLAEASRGRNPDATNTEYVARRSGFAGVIYAVGAYRERGDESWKVLLDALGENLTINRFGVVADDQGRRAIALGSMQADLSPIPRHVKPGGVVMLRGRVSASFREAHVFLTSQDGSTRRLPGQETTFDTVVELDEPGRYKLELMGDGPTGPVVVANLPIYVGVAEPPVEPTQEPQGPLDAEVAARELFDLLNQARLKAHLNPLQKDENLRRIALAHSMDMKNHHFFGHVSPATGTPTDRLEKTGTVVSKYGENVARGPSAKAAHALLMDSPGHRANMLRPDFTHVGIGVTTHSPYGREELLATLVFARRPSLAEVLKTDEEALDLLTEYRKERGGAALSSDPRLTEAAKTGVQAFVEFGASEEEAIDASGQDLVGMGDVCAAFVEVLELSQIRDFPALADPNVESLGVSLTAQPAGDSVVLHVLMLFKARPGTTVHCE